MLKALADSHATGLKADKAERGGWVFTDGDDVNIFPTTNPTTQPGGPPVPNQSMMRNPKLLMSMQADKGFKLVLKFHVHPFTTGDGYQDPKWPSDPDFSSAGDVPNVIIVIVGGVPMIVIYDGSNYTDPQPMP